MWRMLALASMTYVAAFLALLPSPSWAADDFNPPSWVDSDGNGIRDNRDTHFLKPGESMVIGVNPTWVPPANSTSYHWHWFPTLAAFASQGYYEEYDNFTAGQWSLPDHQNNLWNQNSGSWSEAKPPPMPRNWGDFSSTAEFAALQTNPRWQGQAIPAGAPRGVVNGGILGGVTWSDDPNSSELFGGVFEVPLYGDLDMPTTLVRLQFGGGFGSASNPVYWGTALEGFDDGLTVPVRRTFRSVADGTIFYEDWEFDGSPDWIRLTTNFTGTSMVDQVLIDTIAVPEPSMLGLLTLTSFALVRRSRRAVP